MNTEGKAQQPAATREEKPDLDRLYKPVGIAAVSAAAICSSKMKDKTRLKKGSVAR